MATQQQAQVKKKKKKETEITGLKNHIDLTNSSVTLNNLSEVFLYLSLTFYNV